MSGCETGQNDLQSFSTRNYRHFSSLISEYGLLIYLSVFPPDRQVPQRTWGVKFLRSFWRISWNGTVGSVRDKRN